jgi:hypothetical protein
MAGSLELDLDEGNDDDEVETWWQRYGYLAGKELFAMRTVPDPGDPENYFVEEPRPTGLSLVIINMITTYRLAIADEDFVHEFWCYPHDLGILHVFRAWDAFDGEGDPIAGWVKHHPSERRRDAQPR